MKKYINMGSLFILAVMAFSTMAEQKQEPTSLVVNTSIGRVIGIENEQIQSWLGIPYASPPVGSLRWQPPQPLAVKNELIKADTLGNRCAQNADLGVFAKAGGSEDCLYLNIYRSKDVADSVQRRPVFVWIHGGALQVGEAGDYDASKLVTLGQSIVVTINYRLGLFGFLSHQALDTEGHEFGNYGLMDQQAALRWIKQNIANFGGDPTNITIAGESSGGNSVLAHMVAPQSAGLFQHVVAMSGGGIMSKHPAFGAPRPLDVAQNVGLAFAKKVSCENNSAQCLRSLSTQQILDVQSSYALNEFIIDGQVLPIHPAEAYRSGRINHATLINGSTRDEGQFFVALPEVITGHVLTEQDYPTWIKNMYGAINAPKVLTQYPLSNYDNPSEAFAAAATDSMFSCPGLALNHILAEQLPVYAYEFSDRTAPTYLDYTSFPLLAAHTYELAYLFPGFHGVSDIQVNLNRAQEKLSDEMVSYFSRVSTISSQKTQWTRFDPKQDNLMTFALPGGQMVSGRFADTHHCEFWNEIGIY